MSSLITFHQYDQYSTGKFLSYFLFTQQPHPVPYRSIGLELAYAITYHKIQSRTMNRVILDLHKWPGTLPYPLHFHFQPFPFSTLCSGHRNTPFIWNVPGRHDKSSRYRPPPLHAPPKWSHLGTPHKTRSKPSHVGLPGWI